MTILWQSDLKKKGMQIIVILLRIFRDFTQEIILIVEELIRQGLEMITMLS